MQTVLLVENDPAKLVARSLILRCFAYKVLEAGSRGFIVAVLSLTCLGHIAGAGVLHGIRLPRDLWCVLRASVGVLFPPHLARPGLPGAR